MAKSFPLRPSTSYPLPASCATLLALSSALVFLGRAYQYLWWDAPLRAFFWDQKLLEPIVSGWFGRGWQAYATDLAVVENISRLQLGIGLIWALAAVGSLALLQYNNRWLRTTVLAGTSLLLVHALLDTKEHFFHLIQLFEHSLQAGTPLLLILLLLRPQKKHQWRFALKAIIALTFVAHGLYAIGVYPVPANFVDMTIQLLHTSEQGARTFLKVVGLLDLVAAVLLFVPRLIYFGLGYCILWGFLTALARTAIGFGTMDLISLVHQQLYQTVFRLPHGLIPLVLWWWESRIDG